MDTVSTTDSTFTPLPTPEYEVELCCNEQTGMMEAHLFTVIAGQFVGDPVVQETGKTCPDGAAAPTYDIEFYCNDTGTLETWMWTIEGGAVTAGPVVTDTGRACMQPGTPPVPPTYDLEFHCNETTGNLDAWVYTIIDGAISGAPTVTDTGQPCPAPVEPAAQVIDLRCQCMVDDTLNDGTTIAEYVTVTKIVCQADGTIANMPVGDFEDCDMQTPYTPVGATMPACEFGESVEDMSVEVVASAPHRRTITGQTIGWEVPFSMYVQSLTVIAIEGDVTVYDSDGVPSTLHEGESNTWGSPQDIITDLPTFDIPAGGVMSAVWTEPFTQQ